MTRKLKAALAERRAKAREDIAKFRAAFEFHEKLSKILKREKPINYCFLYGNGVLIDVDGLAGLHKARETLRTIEPGYEDKLSAITPCGDRAYARYVTKTDSGVEISIDMWAPIEGFPVSTGPNCGFRKVERPASTEWAYTCQKESQ